MSCSSVSTLVSFVMATVGMVMRAVCAALLGAVYLGSVYLGATAAMPARILQELRQARCQRANQIGESLGNTAVADLGGSGLMLRQRPSLAIAVRAVSCLSNSAWLHVSNTAFFFLLHLSCWLYKHLSLPWHCCGWQHTAGRVISGCLVAVRTVHERRRIRGRHRRADARGEHRDLAWLAQHGAVLLAIAAHNRRTASRHTTHTRRRPESANRTDRWGMRPLAPARTRPFPACGHTTRHRRFAANRCRLRSYPDRQTSGTMWLYSHRSQGTSSLHKNWQGWNSWNF